MKLSLLVTQEKILGLPNSAEASACGDAVVAAHPDSTGDSRLVGYVVPAPGADVNTRALRTRMSGRLPAYMVRTTRGKLQVAAARVSWPARCAKEPAG